MIVRYCSTCGQRYSEASLDNLASNFYISCNSCNSTFYKNPKPVVAGIIEDSKSRILLAQRAIAPHKGSWGLPGGFISYNEEPAAALRREIKEELSVDCKINSIAGVFQEFYNNKGDSNDRLSLTVITYNITLGKGTPKASDDVADIAWFSTLPENFSFPRQRAFLASRQAPV